MPILRILILLTALFTACATAWGQSVTRPTFVALEEVQVMMEEERFTEALEKLEVLALEINDLPYDFALTNQYLAHVSIMLDDAARAQAALQAALSMEDLPVDLRQNMNLFYGTVLLSNEEYELALEALEEWYALAELPQASQIFSLAFANYHNNNLPRAEEMLDKAIGMVNTPQESWYQLSYRVLFDQRKYERAEDVLKIMLERSPNNIAHWRMLASHYLQLEDSAEGLAAMMNAHFAELIQSETDLKQIVSLWGYVDAPERGARLMEQWIEEERIEADAEALKQLGNLWLMSRERSNAISVLTEAAAIAPDGNTYELLGGIYFEEEDWPAAYASYQSALREGELDEPAQVSLLAGISAYRAGLNDQAREALEIAAENEDLKDQAESVLNNLR